MPIEKDVIPMVLLVNMHLIKGTYYKLFSHAAWLIEGQAYSDGTLVPMMRLVQIENDVIPMVLLVNMHLIGDLDYFPLWPGSVQGNSVGPLVPMVGSVPIAKDVIAVVL